MNGINDPAHSGVDVWFVPTPTLSFDQLHHEWGHWLSDDERQRLHQPGLNKGRDTFLLTRLALRYLLSLYYPAILPGQWQFQRSPEGRPHVAGPVADAPAFNLSHADGMLVIAFSIRGDPGIDLEAETRLAPALELAQRYFSVAEVQALTGAQQAQRTAYFLTLWTLKEACVKANGKGLAKSLRHFSFELHDDQRVELRMSAEESSENCHWRLWSAIYETWRVSLALRSSDAVEQCPVTTWLLNWPDKKTSVKWQLDYHCP